MKHVFTTILLSIILPITCLAAAGNGYESPTTVNNITYTHKAVWQFGTSYIVVVFNNTAETCTAINTCSTPISTTNYIGNGYTEFPEPAFIHGINGTQGVEDALEYTCTDIELTNCAYPSAGNSGSTAGTHAIAFYQTETNSFVQLLQLPLPIKDWYNNNASDTPAFEYTNKTHFTYSVPQNGQTKTATSTGLWISAYVTATDKPNLYFLYSLAYQKGTGQPLIPLFDNHTDPQSTIIGDNSVGSSTYIIGTDGKYILQAALCYKTGFWIFETCSNTLLSTTSIFWFGTSTTPYNSTYQNIQDRIQNLLASTTAQIGKSCSPLSSEFNLADCAVFAIVPSTEQLNDDILLLKQLPPWGYAFRAYDILSTDSSSTIPILSITMPQGVPGAGSKLTLDANHALDFVLYAKSSPFGTSTETLYETTSIYWSIFMYLALGLYITRRLLGKSLIPHLGEHEYVKIKQ